MDSSSSRLEEISRHYQLNELNFKKKLFFLVSLMAQTYMSGNLYDEILPGLYLGKILTADEAKKVKEELKNLGLVVSVVEDFELNGKVLVFDLKIQSPSSWKLMDVKHHQLIATDFTADMAIEDTLNTLMLMHETIESGKSVYIHCKAGRGRSVTVVILYLLFFGCKEANIEPKADINEMVKNISEKEIQDVYEFIKTKRNQVNLKEHNFEKINEVVSATSKNGFPNKTPHDAAEKDNETNDVAHAETLKFRLNDFLSSLDAKSQIAQFISFKHLKYYAIDNESSNRKRIIQNFLNDILYAKDAAWYFSLFNNEGPLKQLLDSRPMKGLFGYGNPKRRLSIVEDFKHDLTELLSSILKCTTSQLDCLVENYRNQQEKAALTV